MERYKLTIKKGDELSREEEERLKRLLERAQRFKHYEYKIEKVKDLGNGKVYVMINKQLN